MSNTNEGGSKSMVVVDPVSTGANVAHSVAKHGYQVIAVFSGHTPAALIHMVDPSIHVNYLAVIESEKSSSYDGVVSELKELSKKNEIIAVLAGSELGVECADYISNALKLPLSNSTEMSLARRDKYYMGEAVRNHGVRAVQQARVNKWDQVLQFVQKLNPTPFQVVIKPAKSAGSDGVSLCTSLSDLEDKFNHLVGTKNALGHDNDCAVVQEYLHGVEYVVDTISRNGKHKIVAIWAYDKRFHAGAAFVYFGMTPLPCKGPDMLALVEYQKHVLDALQIRNGPGHGEVYLTSTGPCLVEVGARPHGGEGTFINHANRVWGYNQVDCMVQAYASEEEFNKIPDINEKQNCFGFKVYLVSYVAGVLREIKYKQEISKLSSFMQFDALPNIGDNIYETKDCFTMVGSVMLANTDQEQLNKDTAFVRSLEPTMFDVTPFPQK